MRWSKSFIRTLKETPRDAEVISHILMIRAGLMRKVGSGIYEYLPTGWKTIRKVSQIVREEMDKAGAQEMFMPVLAPAEIWEESGRLADMGKELMRLNDRHGHEFVLGPTHEEIVTDLVRRDVKSYKELPLCLYQIQTKFRDEVRPRFGVMRGREFLMKDGYSFHASQEDLGKYYEVMRETYKKIFKRCGLDTRVVIGHSGAMGGKVAHELMVLAESGESLILTCADEKCGYTATDETATGTILPPENKEQEAEMEKVHTPGKESIEDVTAFLKKPLTQAVKALLYNCDGKLAVAFIRGDRELNPWKLMALTESKDIDIALQEFLETKKEAGVVTGYCGPLNIKPDFLFFDNTVKDIVNGIIGANKKDYHIINFNVSRDFPDAVFHDLVVSAEGDLCPECGKPMRTFRGIEVGNIFQLGTKYSDSLNAKFLDADNQEKSYVMGCYGLGVTRTVAAAIEQHHDNWGIIWPKALAPFDILIQPLAVDNPEVMEVAENLEKELLEKGYDVLFDDRDAKPGFKFKDADLIGVPLRVTISPRSLPEGKIEIKRRCDEKAELISKDGALEKIIETYNSCP